MEKPTIPALVPLWERACRLSGTFQRNAFEDIENAQADMYEGFPHSLEAAQRAMRHWEHVSRINADPNRRPVCEPGD